LTLSAAAVSWLGLLNLWSAVHYRSANFFSKKFSWLGLGVEVFLGVAMLDYWTISRYAYILHAVGISLLIGVLVAGKAVGGGRRWFDIGPFHVQPSELVQLLTVIALGKYLNDSPALEGRTWRHLAIPVAIVSLP